MGKKSSMKDRAYMTATEWKTEGGGCKRDLRLVADRQRHGTSRQHLPLYCCALSFTPFTDPVMLREDAATGGAGSLGFLFDITQLVPYVQKYGSSPISGRKVSFKDVLTVNMHRNNEGAYHCPILNKVFTEHTAIVAVKAKGGDACNVYRYGAVFRFLRQTAHDLFWQAPPPLSLSFCLSPLTRVYLFYSLTHTAGKQSKS